MPRGNRNRDNVWFNRKGRTSPYSKEDEDAIFAAMLGGDEEKWVETIARDAGRSEINPLSPDYRDPLASPEVNTGRTGGSTRMTAAEAAEVSAYWNNMQRGGGAAYWEIEFGPEQADGTREQLGVVPRGMSVWNIENDGKNRGWTDAQIGWLTLRLDSGPINFGGGDGTDGVDGDQPPGPPRSGGGGGGPKYIRPMREVVEDTVKAMLTSLTGDEADDLIQRYSDEYEKNHKKQWDIARKGGTDINPNQVLLESIRGQEDYKRIHALRSEGESETRWISDRVARLTQLGVTSKDADDRAVWLAQSGTNLNDIDTGALQFAKGRKDITLMNKIKKSATTLAGQL